MSVLASACKGMNTVDFAQLTDEQPIKTIAPINNTNGFITFKAVSTTVNIDLAQGLRSADVRPRILDITGTAKNGGNPKFTFHTEESIVGFVQGVNIGNNNATYPADYIEYTDASGVVYSSRYVNDDPFYVYFSSVAYIQGGTLSGNFSGKLQSATGTQLNIKEGVFSVVFSN